MTRASEIERYDDQSVDPQDEAFHAPGDAASWSESYYFYYFDPEQGLGGYTRLGFRPHDGWRDAVHVLYLEGARIGFGYEREAHTASEQETRVGSSQLAMNAPFDSWRIDFDTPIEDCPDGRVLVVPRKERLDGWCRAGRARAALDFGALGAPFYTTRGPGGGHFEHFASVEGELAIDGQSRPFNGFGLRDKSWGPRPWTNQSGAEQREEASDSPFGQGDGWRVYGIWLTAVFHPGLAFALGASPTPDGGMRAQGFLMKDGVNHQPSEVEIETDYLGTTLFQARCRLSARFDDGSELRATGEVLNNGPSKIPHGSGHVTVVNAAMTRFTLDTGETGLGITEYHSSVRRGDR